MRYPNFFDKVPAIALQDPLSDFLGAFEAGELEISYLDCVKLAGHSCPTVAGAYLMAIKGLETLYPKEEGVLPQRGHIHVAMRDGETDGVTGAVCNVISFIVGANGKSGFKGIGGHFSRDNLVSYGIPMRGEVTLTRLATEQRVTLSYDASIVPGDPAMKPLMAKSLQGSATDEEKAQFKTLWQERVARILLSQDLWDQMITIHETKE